MKPLITSRTDWSESLINTIYPHIEEIAFEELGLTNIYPNQIEIISADQMLDAYSSIGMPVGYAHWSFGKSFVRDYAKYQAGKMGLAYEIILNTNPCISYLMEENNAITQALVIAHAAFGHNFVFKNNYMFLEWTQPSTIIDHMIFSKNYILECEEKYGVEEVEAVLDAAHALAPHGVDQRKRKHEKRLSEEERQKKNAAKYDEEHKLLDIVLQTTTIKEKVIENKLLDLDKVKEEENLLYFIYNNAPDMPEWKRNILRIVHETYQYFYAQSHDQVLNEGFATFTHFYIMNRLEEKGIISADAQMAWLMLHSNVIYQTDLATKEHVYRAGSFNPYNLGFNVYKEIQRICTSPTKEDEEWFPQLVGQDWRAEIRKAASDYRDDSFLQQYLSPNLMRQKRMMTVNVKGNVGVVTEICDDQGYKKIRNTIAAQHTRIESVPDISVTSARLRGDRMLTLEYRPYFGRQLHKHECEKTLQHVKYLWGYDAEIIERDVDNKDISTVKFQTQ